ncbi:MAG: hypothetical protein QOG82_2352 [Actinomycetota bacterium]|nr:hypothetical protein [Actinomycetota bacterium]
MLLGACSDPASPPPSTVPSPSTAVIAPTTTAAPVAPATVASTVPTVVPTTTVAPVAGPAFTGAASAVTAAELGSSWRPGCPVAPEDLRLLRMSYWGFDDQPHVGALVVAASVAAAVLEVFHTLYDQRFPIRRMEPVDVYGADDDASMAVDNTSAFNCRPAVAEGPPHWSNHAYGLAVDVNPVENPYVLGGRVLPPAGAEFVDRSVYRPGMAVTGGVLTSAFAAVGWGWGGTWSNPDYQHFSSTGG